MEDIKKGQKVWVSLKHGIEETKIKSAGSKYITLDWNPKIKFYRDTLIQVDSCGTAYFIILDLEGYKKDKHYNILINKFKRLNWNTVKREDLDKIAEILKDY